jgi:hypothetical protein
MIITLGGRRWEVRLVPRGSKWLEGDQDEYEIDGRTHPSDGVIAIAKDLSPSAREETLVHEILHAAMQTGGGSHVLQLKCKGDHEEAEELLVRCLTPILHRLLIDWGVKLPKVG